MRQGALRLAPYDSQVEGHCAESFAVMLEGALIGGAAGVDSNLQEGFEMFTVKHGALLLLVLSATGCASLLAEADPTTREQVVAAGESVGGAVGGLIGGPAGALGGAQIGGWIGEAAIAAFLIYHKATEKKRHAAYSSSKAKV